MNFATIQDCNAPYTNPWPLFTAKILPWPNYPKPGKSLQWTCDLIPSKTHPLLNKQTKLLCLFGVRVKHPFPIQECMFRLKLPPQLFLFLLF